MEKIALILTYEWKKMGKEEKKGKIKKTTKYQPFRILKLQALENTLICYSTLKHVPKWRIVRLLKNQLINLFKTGRNNR